MVEFSDAGLTEEEILIENATTPDTIETIHRTTLLLRMKDDIVSLARILRMIEVKSMQSNEFLFNFT